MAKKKAPINHVETIPEPLEPEPLPDAQADVTPVEPEPTPVVIPEFVAFDHGQFIVTTGKRRQLVMIDGVSYEHVSETHDGRWVYAKS